MTVVGTAKMTVTGSLTVIAAVTETMKDMVTVTAVLVISDLMYILRLYGYNI